MQEWIEYCELVCQYLAVKAHRDALTMWVFEHPSVGSSL
jgi:hypothetical protein